MNKAILALALLTGTASATVDINLSELEAKEEAGELGSRVFFKLDETSSMVAGGSKYRDDTAAKIASLLDCTETKEKRIFREAGKFEKYHQAAGLHLWYQATCTSAYGAIQKFAHSSDNVVSAVQILEPELKVQTIVQSDDPQLGDQTHYSAINLFEAWDIERGSPDVVVQVLDTGIDMDHPDLQNNIWTNEGEICGNGIDDDNNGYVDDCHGYNHADDTGDDLLGNHWHGTHCGGTIAADTDNGIGVAGVAGGTPSAPGAKLMISVGFGDSNTGGFAEALVYGADNGAEISSNSWGYTSPGYIEAAVKDAIDYYNSKNGIVVFAAGNDDSSDDYYPGYYDGVVAVAAVADSGVRASFSNYGDWIDISAPGVNVLSTLTNGEYGRASGTSMACPHVAGVLALGMSANPDLTKEEILECAYSTATNIDSINGGYAGQLGAGNIDAHAFVNCVANGAPSPAPTHSVAPTTPAPSMKPTFSKAPTTSCGVCDQKLEVVIMTDNYPGETTYTLEMNDPSAPDCKVASASGGPFGSANSEYTAVLSTEICAGESYTFKIFDSFGDGICCSWGQGYYKLLLNGNEIESGGEFGSEETFTFTAPVGGVTTKSPTTGPATVPTQAPSLRGTAGPTAFAEPPAMPIDFEMRGHPKLGPVLINRWKAGSATQTTHKYIVQYKVKGTSVWIPDSPDDGVALEPEWDGQIYYVLSNPALECNMRLTSRVAHIKPNGAISDFAVSKERKVKC